MEKVIDVKKRYGHEINEIKNKLNQLENGRVYEISGYQGDGYLATNISQLKKMLNELINKLEYNKESVIDEIFKAIDK